MVNGHSDSGNGSRSVEGARWDVPGFGTSSVDPYLLALSQYPTTPRRLEQSLLLLPNEWLRRLYYEAQRRMWHFQQLGLHGVALPPGQEAVWLVSRQHGAQFLGPAPHSHINELDLGDAEIEMVLSQMIDAHPWTALTEIEVAAENRAVTLRGDAPNERVKALVEMLAWQVPGVSDVHNAVQIRSRRPRQGASGE